MQTSKLTQPSNKMKPGKGTKTGLQNTTNWPKYGAGVQPGQKA